MKKFAVIGQPIEHSLSPVIHQTFATQCKVALDYQKLAATDFAATAGQFFDAGGFGVNVTVPFKINALEWVSELDDLAAEAGAVNTISRTATGFKGYNTDGLGLLTDIKRQFENVVCDRRVLVLGAGGAARGIVGPLLRERPQYLVVANRTLNKAHKLVKRFASFATPLEAMGLDDLSQPFDLIVNATATSMASAPFSLPVAVMSGATCYDLYYQKEPTPFCAMAVQLGAVAVSDGLGMLIEQAAFGFHIWWQQHPDTSALHYALRSSL